MCVKINGDTPKRALLKEARGPTRRAALLKIITKGRPFHVTRKGAFIVRVDGKSLYGRKSKSCAVPTKIMKKRCKN